jgi:hypothetical protein
MQKKSTDPTPRNFDPMAAMGLSDEAREAVNAAFDAMSAWRIETANSNEKNSQQVVEKLAAAARALGWPAEIVDVIHAQIQSITKLQVQAMDQIMDAWEEQIKTPNAITGSSAAMLAKLRSLPGLGQAATSPDMSQMASMNPFQLWIQFAEQWQKASADAMSSWAKGGRTSDAGGPRRR